jgi:hypothetical protein
MVPPITQEVSAQPSATASSSAPVTLHERFAPWLGGGGSPSPARAASASAAESSLARTVERLDLQVPVGISVVTCR